METNKISFFNKMFWDLWLQKIFRNVASVKFQWMAVLYLTTIFAMFTMNPVTGTAWLSTELGFGFLGGGFVTFCTARIIANTSLTESKDDDIDTDR
jgi:hypothetical protein